MKRLIAIVDLRNGRIHERPSDTLTLDVPADLDRPDGVVSLDEQSHGHYIANDGKSREYSAFVRPLSWRTFLAAHWGAITAADFFTTEVWTTPGSSRTTRSSSSSWRHAACISWDRPRIPRRLHGPGRARVDRRR